VAGLARPRVLLTVSRQPDRLADVLTVGHEGFLADMIDLAGGVNVFGDLDMDYPQVSIESILARRPDVIIELMPEVEMTPALHARIVADWGKLGPIPAVRKGGVHILTDDHCLIPSPRYVEIIERVSRILHPDRAVERQRTTSDAQRR
jgi:ABC-type Fe3+-hydroxamate transport system substrate-binding protein